MYGMVAPGLQVALTWVSAGVAIDVPDAFTLRVAGIAGVDPYRDRAFDEREVPVLRAALHDARLAAVREHVRHVGGDTEAWQQTWLARRLDEDAWVRHLDALLALVDLGQGVRVIGD